MLSQALPPALTTGGCFVSHSEPFEFAHRWPLFDPPSLPVRRMFSWL